MKTRGLKDKLRDEGFSFEFFQAVRLLENLYPGSPLCGGDGPYKSERIRIRPNRDMGFPPGDIRSVEQLGRKHDGADLWRITENFMGLYGVNSPLPSFIPVMIAQAYHDEDPLRDFLDIFNHRILSLYYRAWKKHQLAPSCDPTSPMPLVFALGSMIGRQNDIPDDDWAVAPERLIRYAGLLSSQARPAGGLEAMVSDFFGLREVKVKEFLPKKVRLGGEDLTRLGAGERNNQLGCSVILGDMVKEVGGQFRLTLGPLDLDSFLKFQPGGEIFMQLNFLVRLYTRNQLDYELELILKSDQVETITLSSRNPKHGLGRYSWLGAPAKDVVSATLNS